MGWDKVEEKKKGMKGDGDGDGDEDEDGNEMK